MPYKEAFSAIRGWYKAHRDENPWQGRWKDISDALIDNLPCVAHVNDLEMRVIFNEVIAGSLEWSNFVERQGPTAPNIATIFNIAHFAQNSKPELISQHFTADEITAIKNRGNWWQYCANFLRTYDQSLAKFLP